MSTYNVVVPVVALVEASSPEDAIEQLKALIKATGLDPYEGEGSDAFESEATS